MSMPKGMLVAAHGEAYEQHMVTVKAHHMFWIRQFQQFAAAPTHLSMLPMLPHLSSESITISELASLDARAYYFVWWSVQAKVEATKVTKVLRALDQEVLTFLSFTEATVHTFEDFSWKLCLCFEHSTREMGGKVPQSARISTYLAWATTNIPRMFDKMNYGIYRRYG